jgi:hypothetical protein
VNLKHWKENNETKFKNIFEDSVKMIDNFIKNNKKQK